MPRSMVIELNCAVADKLDERQKVHLANENTHFMLSSILHGEQGALSLSASLCMILRDAGAQEYATNQAREEARHVTGFAKYIERRWGKPLAVGTTLKNLMTELVLAPEVYKKLVGMQMLIEGLAMGAFATIHSRTNVPLLQRLVQMVMTDEAFHHKFGKIWAERTVPKLSEEEHEKVEAWAARCFETLLFNRQLRAEAGDLRAVRPRLAMGAQRRHGGVHRHRPPPPDDREHHIFRVLIKTLLKAGIITDRTKSMYAAWVDMDGLAGGSDEVVGSDVAEAGMAYLREINKDRKKIGKALRYAS
jgi:hypothetical protein